jgi:hypothetical protein
VPDVIDFVVPTLKRVAPIFPVSDLGKALLHYRRLGFATREYVGGGYGYAVGDSVEIHLAAVRHRDPTATAGSAYLWVDDADALASEWEAAGVSVHWPVDTAWGQHEGSHTDPDGNLLRFGSPVADPGTGAQESRNEPEP